MVQSLSAPIKIDSKEIVLADWLEYLADEKNIPSMRTVQQAAVLAQMTGEHIRTPLGTSCLHQGLVMSEILADLNADTATLCAGIIAPCVLYAELSKEDVSEHFGEEVFELIEGMLALLAFQDLQIAMSQPRHHPKVDNLRKMFLAMVSDVRVVLLKLAERVYMMHNLNGMDHKECQRLAKETEAIYAPLANRLGVGDVKWQLEDLSFRYMRPKTYRQISKGLNQKRLEREAFVWEFMAELRRLLTERSVKIVDLTGRVKHIFSIYKKMEKKKVRLDQVYDTTAVRVIVDSVADCYEVLSTIHDQWSHVPEEFDDYVASPKANGYRSIHTAVVVQEGRHIEVQIRTMEMHQQAELGAAAHWLYKESRTKKNDIVVDKIAWLRQMLAWQDELTNESRGLSKTYQDVFSDRIYVFTPKDEVFDLPLGATVLDFAYLVHTEVGHHCSGAKVNGKMVPLTTALATGNRVEILTAKNKVPARDWLNPHLGYLTTSKAKAKVHHWFKLQHRDENIHHGQIMLQQEMKKLGYPKQDLAPLLAHLRYQAMDELFCAVGCGEMRLPTLITGMQTVFERSKEPVSSQKTAQDQPKRARRKSTHAEAAPPPVLVDGISGMVVRLAVCCQPVAGDQIIGYVTQGRGVSVHRSNCRNIGHLRRRFKERFLPVSWQQREGVGYPVDIVIDLVQYSDAIMEQLQKRIVQQKISCTAKRPLSPAENGGARWVLTLSVVSLSHLSACLTHLLSIPEVKDAYRLF